MNDALARAAALRQLIERPTEGSAHLAVAEAVVGCCRDLVEAGEAKLALTLAISSEGFAARAGSDWVLRLSIVRIEALTSAGELTEAMELLRRVVVENERLLANSTSESYRLRIDEAQILWLMNRADDAVRALSEIRRELLTKPDSVLLASCANQISAAETIRGNYDAARDFALEAVVSARRCKARALEARALVNLGLLERQRCRWSNAEEDARGALVLLEREGARIQVCHATRSLGVTEWKRGRLAAALDWADRSHKEATALNHGLLLRYSTLLKSMILLHGGDVVGARDATFTASTLVPPDSDSRPSLLTIEFMGDISLEQGQAEPALKYYDEVWPKALAIVPKGDIVAELRRRRAECHLLLGHHELAYDEAKTGLEHCRELGDRYEEAATYRVLGLAAAALGRPQEAKQHFTQGFAYYDDIETPYEWGKLWMSYGDWLRGPHAGEYADPKGALEAYFAARDHFERMGALAKLAEVNARIAEHGAPLGATGAPGAAAASGATPLSTAGEPRRPQRRPRLSAELTRRATWAHETFGLVTRNAHLLALLDDVSKLARSNAPILVLGESGTGKELIAGGIHKLSVRAGAYMPVNCSALPREVIENELFGHVAGGFTGALRDKPGLFEICDGGTIFLDEIAEMSLDLQSKLLRFLESGELRRIGSSKNLTVDTRVVAATNRDRAALEDGETVRKDLYYRLAHAVVELPPLRHRGDDAGLLVDHFLEQSCRQEHRRVTLSDEAWERLVRYSWPGNVRQLKSVVRRIVLLAPDGHEVSAAELKLEEAAIAATLIEEMEQAERRRVIEVLERTRGSRTEAAKLLGVPRTTLLNKMKRYGLR